MGEVVESAMVIELDLATPLGELLFIMVEVTLVLVSNHGVSVTCVGGLS